MRTFVIGDVHGRREQLRQLIEMLPRDPSRDALVLLGDLIDRGEDAPGVVTDVIQLQQEADGAPVVVLRGNHEQMLLDFIDEDSELWLHPATGSERTFEQYVGRPLFSELTREEIAAARRDTLNSIPAEQIEFLRGLPLYYEDDYAIYVHAGLEKDKHPRDTDARHLLWSRNGEFYRSYYGKPCVFGHTPTPFLPLLGRLGRHGIYISHSAIGIDTGYSYTSPLSCLQLPEFTLYQTFADGRPNAAHHITKLIPEALRALQKENGGR